MKKCMAIAAAVAMFASVASAEGVPSQSKLSKLGLSSMTVASDVQGETVRGKFISTAGLLALGTSTTGTTGGGVATFPLIAALTHISGNAPRAFGNTSFGLSALGTFTSATDAAGNPAITNQFNAPTVVTVSDVTGTAQMSIQFWSQTAGN